VAFEDAVEVSGEEGTEREKRMWGGKIAGGSLGSRKNELPCRCAEISERRGSKSQGAYAVKADHGELQIRGMRGQIVGFL